MYFSACYKTEPFQLFNLHFCTLYTIHAAMRMDNVNRAIILTILGHRKKVPAWIGLKIDGYMVHGSVAVVAQ